MLIKTVSALLYTNNNEVLLHRHKRFGMYVGPGGKVQDEEHESAALIREVFEETGIILDLHQGEIDYQRIKIKSPDETIVIQLDDGITTLIDHIYFIRVGDKIRQQKLITEYNNEMNWYNIEYALDTFPMFTDTRLQVHSIKMKLDWENSYIYEF